MYFDELKIGMTVDTAPAAIMKEKMMAFARDYDNIPLHTDEAYNQNGELVLMDVTEAIVKRRMPDENGIVNRGDIL